MTNGEPDRTHQVRGQITPVDVAEVAAGLVVMAALAPVVYTLLGQNSGGFRTGTVMLWQMVIPGALLTMLIIFFAIAVGGGD